MERQDEGCGEGGQPSAAIVAQHRTQPKIAKPEGRLTSSITALQKLAVETDSDIKNEQRYQGAASWHSEEPARYEMLCIAEKTNAFVQQLVKLERE